MKELLARHDKIALSFSGGKDSTACVYLLKEYLPRITLYHLDTGDLLPEVMEHVARIENMVPHFVRIETDVKGWIEEHGLPSDLVPYTAHPVARHLGQMKTPIVSRYDCCWANLMMPVFERVQADGNTLMIRGTKKVDMPMMPARSGDVAFGVELYYPLEDWSHEQVFAFLAVRKVRLPRLYDHMVNAPECARCSAWWGEGRATYLKKFYPELFEQYNARLQLVINEIAGPLAELKREAEVA